MSYCHQVTKKGRRNKQESMRGESHFLPFIFLKIIFHLFFLFLIYHKLKKERREFYESLELDAEGPVGVGGHVRGRRSWDPRSLTLLTRAGG